MLHGFPHLFQVIPDAAVLTFVDIFPVFAAIVVAPFHDFAQGAEGIHFGSAELIAFGFAFRKCTTADAINRPFLDKIVFDYDAATGSFKSDSTFYVNQGYKKPNQLYTYDEPAFAPWTEKAATPMEVGEENVSYYPYNNMDGYGILTFIPSEFDADGNLLDTKQLYYTVYLDDEPLAFDTQDYPSLKEETTEILYLFNDQENIVYYAGALNVKTFVEGIDSICVLLIYKGGGEVRKSAISYVSAKDEEDTDGIGNIGANASKFVGTVFTDLSGRKVALPAKGVYIQTVRKADGTVKSVKRVFK
ncbi:putative uncharacterized protein [Prevotella sp. CAG:1092]|nr:putative uncharacterized protein [Prevotella sp. CAG:1092]